MLLGLGVTACGGSDTPAEVVAERLAPVRVATAAPAEFLSQISTVGRVEPDRTYVLAFKTPGVVSRLNVQEGDAVRKGQVLAELDPRDVNAQLRNAQEAADKADRELARIRQLHTRGFASDAELQDAQAQTKSTQAVAQAARSDRTYASIVAPSDGIVLRRNVEANSVVAAGAPVMTLSDMSESFVLAAGLADRDALRVALGDTAEVTFDAFPDQVFAAVIAEIGADADQRTGTFQIKLRITETNAALKSGLVGRATITPAIASGADLAIPVDAILEGHGDQAHRLRRRPGHRGRAAHPDFHRPSVWRHGCRYVRRCRPATRSWSMAPAICQTARKSLSPLPARSEAMNIAGFAVRNWQFTLVLTLLFAALGYNAFQSVPRAEDPSFDSPFFTVITIASGMEATEVEKLITDTIEDAFNELDDVEEIESTTNAGVSIVQVAFDWALPDMDRKYDEIIREMNRLRPDLPEAVNSVTVRKGEPGLTNIVQFALVGDVSYRELTDRARDLKDLLEGVNGVRQVEVWGAPEPEVRVGAETGAHEPARCNNRRCKPRDSGRER